MSDSDPERGAVDCGVAVIGMAGRFPGAPSVDAFWRNLRDGVESVVEAELARHPAHLLARALERERRINPHREPGGQSFGAADRQRTRRLALAFEVDRDPGADRRFQLLVALSGAGEADGQAQVRDSAKFTGRGDVEAVDQS